MLEGIVVSRIKFAGTPMIPTGSVYEPLSRLDASIVHFIVSPIIASISPLKPFKTIFI